MNHYCSSHIILNLKKEVTILDKLSWEDRMKINGYNSMVELLKNYNFKAIPRAHKTSLMDTYIYGDVQYGLYDLKSNTELLKIAKTIEDTKDPFKVTFTFNIKFDRFIKDSKYVDNLIIFIESKKTGDTSIFRKMSILPIFKPNDHGNGINVEFNMSMMPFNLQFYERSNYE